MTSSSRSSCSGYTLLEMLVALTLLGFVAVLLSGSFQFGARTWEASTHKIDRIGEVEAAQGFLRRQLAQTLRISFRVAGAEPGPAFVGSSDELRFSAPLALRTSDGGLYVFALGTSTSGSIEDLSIRWQVYRPDQPPEESLLSEPSVVLPNIAGLQLAYYGAMEVDDDPRWQSEWRGKSAPMLVRIDVSFPEDDRRAWPSFIVALKSAGGARR